MILEKKIPFRYWFDLIKRELLIVSVFSTGIHFISKYLIEFEIPISIGGFLGTSIALLLSFKLSQSYDRWWEARKIWGSIVNDSRSIVIQLFKFSREDSTHLIEEIALRQIAWCYALAFTLRNQTKFSYLKEFMALKEIESIKKMKNIPLAILNLQSESLSNLYKKKVINDFQQIQIDNTLVRLCESMGRAERIKKTVFPKTYRMTLKFFIYLFLVILSLSLPELNSWITIPLLVAISTPFLLLERISKNIQNPFDNNPTDIPMLSISKTIENNIKQLLDPDFIPDEQDESNFYLM